MSSFFVDDLVEQRVGFGEELPRLLAVLLVLEDARVDALELPGVEERRPVDELAQRREREVVEHAHAGEARAAAMSSARHAIGVRVGARRLERHQLVPAATRAACAAPRSRRGAAATNGGLALVAQQAGGHRHGAAGVEHVHHRLAVVRRDLDRRVRPAGGRAADRAAAA